MDKLQVTGLNNELLETPNDFLDQEWIEEFANDWEKGIGGATIGPNPFESDEYDYIYKQVGKYKYKKMAVVVHDISSLDNTIHFLKINEIEQVFGSQK